MSCRGHAPDGFTSHAGISPPDASALERFLDQHDDGPAYLVEHADAEGECETLAWRVQVEVVPGEEPPAVSLLECVLLPPGSGIDRIPVEAVDAIHAGEPPTDTCRVVGATDLDAAIELSDVAEERPGLVAMADVRDLLRSESPPARENALRALSEVARTRPGECVDLVDRVASLLETPRHATAALATLYRVAEEYPDAVSPHASRVAEYLTGSDEETLGAAARVMNGPGLEQEFAARCLAAVADHEPGVVVDAVPKLDTLLAERGEGLPYAVLALQRVASEYPSQVRPAAGTLGEVAADDSLDAGLRVNVMATIGRVTQAFPDAALEAVEDAVGLLDAEDYRLRANGAALLCDASIADPSVSKPYVGDLEELLRVEDDRAVANASGALSRLAGTDPGAVAHLENRFVILLEHHHERVRRNACVAVGHLRTEAGEMMLERLADEDEVDSVRKQAEWALERVR